MSAVSLVQGASRGIGLGFCRALLARSSDSLVIATSRKPSTASELQNLQIQYPQRLTVLSVDVTDSRQIEDAASFVKNQFGRLDLLINSAGILHPSGKGETSLRDVNQEVVIFKMCICPLESNFVHPSVLSLVCVLPNVNQHALQKKTEQVDRQ